MSIPADSSERKTWVSPSFAAFAPLPALTPELTPKHLSDKAWSSSRWRQAFYFKVRFKTTRNPLSAGTSFFLKSDGAFEDFSVLSHQPATYRLFHWRPPGWDPVFLFGQVNTRTKMRSVFRRSSCKRSRLRRKMVSISLIFKIFKLF